MPLAAGDKLGPYEILALIGDVAIKVTSERFDREAHATQPITVVTNWQAAMKK